MPFMVIFLKVLHSKVGCGWAGEEWDGKNWVGLFEEMDLTKWKGFDE